MLEFVKMSFLQRAEQQWAGFLRPRGKPEGVSPGETGGGQSIKRKDDIFRIVDFWASSARRCFLNGSETMFRNESIGLVSGVGFPLCGELRTVARTGCVPLTAWGLGEVSFCAF